MAAVPAGWLARGAEVVLRVWLQRTLDEASDVRVRINLQRSASGARGGGTLDAVVEARSVKYRGIQISAVKARVEALRFAQFAIAEPCPAIVEASFSPEDFAATLTAPWLRRTVQRATGIAAQDLQSATPLACRFAAAEGGNGGRDCEPSIVLNNRWKVQLAVAPDTLTVRTRDMGALEQEEGEEDASAAPMATRTEAIPLIGFAIDQLQTCSAGERLMVGISAVLRS